MRALGDLFWLRLGNRVLRSYMDPSLEALERIEFAFYAMFAVEAWYTDLHIKHEAAKKARKAAKKEEQERVCKEKNWTKAQYKAEMKKIKEAETARAKQAAALAAAVAATDAVGKPKRQRRAAAPAPAPPAAVSAAAATRGSAIEEETVLENGEVEAVRVSGVGVGFSADE
jgi:hypothetical protein